MQTTYENVIAPLDAGTFIAKALCNTNDEKLFWHKLNHKEFSLEEEYSLLKVLAQLSPDNDYLKARVLSLKGGLYCFTQYDYKDILVGINFLKEAKDLGNASAMVNLGYIYLNGLAGIKNFDEAAKLFEQGTKLGHSSAMTHLGYMYQMGMSVPHNNLEALKLYKQAAELNNRRAKDLLQKLEAKLALEAAQTEVLSLRKLYIQSKNDNIESKLRTLQKEYPTDYYIQYQCLMALDPQNINNLFDESHIHIGDCILYDSLLTDKQKYELLSEKYLDKSSSQFTSLAESASPRVIRFLKKQIAEQKLEASRVEKAIEAVEAYQEREAMLLYIKDTYSNKVGESKYTEAINDNLIKDWIAHSLSKPSQSFFKHYDPAVQSPEPKVSNFACIPDDSIDEDSDGLSTELHEKLHKKLNNVSEDQLTDTCKISNFTCEFFELKNKELENCLLRITSDDGDKERLTITNENKKAILACGPDDLIRLVEILKNIPKGEDIACMLEVYTDPSCSL